MALIDLPTAKAHLRVEEDYPDEQVEPYLRAAEESAQQYLNCRLFLTAGELSTARASLPQKVADATTARATAIAAAQELTDEAAREWALRLAEVGYAVAMDAVREQAAGAVLNDSVRAAILLTLGNLHENRESVVAGVSVAELPFGARMLLAPFRVDLGV